VRGDAAAVSGAFSHVLRRFALQTCPLLLRVFPKLGGHHRAEDFPARGPLPKDEFQARS
jgi:hypothetical protein